MPKRKKLLTVTINARLAAEYRETYEEAFGGGAGGTQSLEKFIVGFIEDRKGRNSAQSKMIVTMSAKLATSYKSPTQRARVVTEDWAEQNLFCPACLADHLLPSPANTRAVDFGCSRCSQTFQLKAKSSPITNKVIDGAYSALMAALCSDTAPNLFLLPYTVENLPLIPHFAFPPSAIECRKPLSASARRAGWVGCFIVLSRIPTDARIGVVCGGELIPARVVRAQYQRLLPLKHIAAPRRGWTLDVLHAVRSLGKLEFTNADIYARADVLRAQHPENRHITEKIRQQLQMLRDTGFLTHMSRGSWRLA
jgi:type II restriction enzyme